MQVKKEREAFIKQGMDDSALAVREVIIILDTIIIMVIIIMDTINIMVTIIIMVTIKMESLKNDSQRDLTNFHGKSILKKGTKSSLIKCGGCGKSNTTYHQAQTRYNISYLV